MTASYLLVALLPLAVAAALQPLQILVMISLCRPGAAWPMGWPTLAV